MNKEEKENSWSLSLDHEFKVKMKPYGMPRLRQAIAFVPLTFRLLHMATLVIFNLFNLLKI